MAPVKTSNKSADVNPWSWVSQVKPEDVNECHVLTAYRITGFQPCVEARRNCKRNPYCVWGLGEKKWKDDNDGDDDEEGAAFRCEGEYAGLQNLGATCYVNSFLQLWFHNPIFRPVVLNWTPASIQTSETLIYKPNCPLGQLQAIFARLKTSKRSKIDPSDFVGSLLINTGEQQDAQEFAKLFMEFIIKLLTDYGDDKIQKRIAQSFSGQSQYETECLGCKNKTQRSEEFTELNLSVKKNLNESLDELLADEIISDEYMCSNCHQKNTAKRRLQLLSLPPILNLQLMRFVFDREALRRKKVTQSISFPEVLEMQDRIHKRNSTDANAYKYHLTAVLIHNGPSASSGHYVAQIKDLRNGEWLKFNDEFVDPVNKGKSQKATDENEEPDKKVKIKKSKNSPSLSSSGAYMLVYTLDHTIKNPDPDPELHEYLVDLVRREDASFEIEVNKTKSEKDFEQSVRTQRRKEVEWLYEFKKTSKGVNGKASEPGDHVEEPKTKIPRYDKELKIDDSKSSDCNEEKMEVDEGPCDSTKDGSTETRPNGTHSEVSALPLREKTYNSDEIDFVSVDWITQWLDPGNPVPPIENGMLLCEHKKLAPPQPNSIPCLYRIIPTPLANVWYEHYQGGPRLKGNDVCQLCVQSKCCKLRALAALDEDAKRVSDFVKKCDSELSVLLKAGESIPPALLENMCWINKDSLRNWKRLAKTNIEGPTPWGNENGSESKENDSHFYSEEGGETQDSFNRDLFCEHGSLSHDSNSRKMIPIEAWTIITTYFKDAIMLNAGETPCDDCRNQEHANSLAVQQSKEVATKQKTILSDLYLNRNRPTVDRVGDLYIVSESFISQWRRFVKDPSRYDIVRKINNHTLLCEHDKFKYPLAFASEFLSIDDEACDKVCLVTQEEWGLIQKNFYCDHEIKATVSDTKDAAKIVYDPDICNECVESWIEGAFKRQFEYTDSPLCVVKREKGETIESEEEEPVKEPANLGKRESKPVNRDAWMAGLSSSVNDSVRRSQRPRSTKGEKVYKVSSSMTIKDLKSKICTDFKALLSDQHLFYESLELTDLKKSLQDYSIPVKSKLYLEIDTAENGTVEEPASTVETGFQGTLLQGGGGNAYGDTRSPVQNN